MSKRPHLLSDDDIERIVDELECTGHAEVDMERAAMAVRIRYEEARAKDAELIQKLVARCRGLWVHAHYLEPFQITEQT